VEWELVDRDVQAGRLVRLFDVGVRVAPEYAYYLVHPAGAAADSRVQALREWMLAAIGQQARQ